MDNASSAPIPPELQVSMDTELLVNGLDAAEQQRLQGVLTALPGVECVTASGQRFAIRYDPERVSQARMSEAMAAAGFPAFEVESGPVAPTMGASDPDGG